MSTRIFIAIAAAAVLGSVALTAQAFMKADKKSSVDEQGHVLSSMWKTYYTAQKADLPKKMAESLEAIKKEAKAKRYHWDFYDAARKYVDAEVSRNWKLRQELNAKLAAEIEEYAEPIVTYAYKSGRRESGLDDYILTNKARLQSGRNPAFYSRTTGSMNNLLNKFIKDDFEYALWSEKLIGRNSSKVSAALRDCLGETYPNAAWLEYLDLTSKYWDSREKETEDYILKYKGRAVSLFGKSLLFQDRLTRLSRDKASEGQYKALYEDIKAAERERKSFTSGTDGKIASAIMDFKHQLENLERKEIELSIDDRTVTVALRNLDKVDVCVIPDVKEGKPLVEKTIVNPVRRFFVMDTVKFEIPRCDDGDYIVRAKNGKIQAEGNYIPKTLSFAIRDDSEGKKFYVTDYLTGEPIDKVDLSLSLSQKERASVKGIPQDGFTLIPEEITSKITSDAYYLLEASYRDADGFLHKSRMQGVDNYVERYVRDSRTGTYCSIFTDKTAFNPGETVKFKAVFYEGDLNKGVQVLDAGKSVQAWLMNSEGKEISKAELSTNEYGSVAGEFLIPEGERNGRFSVEVRYGTDHVSSKSIIVDEFILPTYDLSFNSVDSLYFVGDEIEVKGIVSSYSGHPLDAAQVSYSIDGRGRRISQGDIDLAQDGAFSVRFKSLPDIYWYNVTVKVKDSTGETKEFSRSVFVLDQINLEVDLENAAEGEVSLSSSSWEICRLLSVQEAKVKFTAFNTEGISVPVKIDYRIENPSGKVVESGSAMSGETESLGLPGPGRYKIVAEAKVTSSEGKVIFSKQELSVLMVGDSDKVLASQVENFFKLVGPCADGKVRKGEDIIIQMGAGDGPVWAVVELFGDMRQPLERRLVHLQGQAGKPGSIETMSFEYKDDYPEALWLSIFYFRQGRHFVFQREFRKEKESMELPLSFSSFEDKALPGKEYSFVLDSKPGTEILAAVFDKSSEAISPNSWPTVRLSFLGAESVFINAMDGGIDRFGSSVRVGYGTPMFKTRSTGVVMEELAVNAAMAPEPMMASMEDSAFERAVMDEESVDDLAEDVAVRSDFSTSLAFEPFLRTGNDGKAVFKFRTSEKLSTFVVQVYAHTKDMKNTVLRKEMTVSIPVKVNVVEPKYLYKGDKYVLHATVSSNAETPVAGTVILQAYPSSDSEGQKPFASFSKKVTVPAHGSVPVEFNVDPKNHDHLGLKVVFSDTGKTFSDGVFVSLPVLDAEQTLTESHSAVLLPGMDKDALIKQIQSAFTGTTAKGAEYKEVDIRQMLIDAIPSKVEPSGKDVLSLSEALYVRRVASKLGVSVEPVMPDDELVSKILSCRNQDGGFGWFEGMRSSPVITAVLLERFAKLRDSGLGIEGVSADESVAYLDRNQFLHDNTWPYWSGWLSIPQYAHVRSMYCMVPFDVEARTVSEVSDYSKNFKEFKKYIKDYLIPSEKDGRGLNGQILSKARRIKTLANLIYSEGGAALASAWGMKSNSDSKMKASLSADAASLYEYAVEHRDGGWYYPNAVMPWRGLLESELYAHSLLCDLLSDTRVAISNPGLAANIADGIRIWIMLQKETQQWADDPAYVDAINSVLSGEEGVLSTRVILMTKTYKAPFSDIRSAGNGFTVERHFYKEVLGEDAAVGRVEIYPGMKLKTGDKIICEYKVWNQENRSFVKLTAPREAAFRPVEQLSGHVGWWARPVGGIFSVTPQGYRNVKSDRTEYFFDVYPEENTTVTEEFFITQEGSFVAPVVTIESLYAPHYRANDKFGGILSISE